MSEESKAMGQELINRVRSLLDCAAIMSAQIEKVEANEMMFGSLHESVSLKLDEKTSMTLMLFTRDKS